MCKGRRQRVLLGQVSLEDSIEDAVFTKNDSNLPALLERLPVASSESLPCHPPSQPAETLILQR